MKKFKRMEFSKKLLILDYIILFALIILAAFIPEVDFTSIIVAWIAQLGLTSAAYYWKSRCENRIKIPFKVAESLTPEMKEDLNLTEIILAIITSSNSN